MARRFSSAPLQVSTKVATGAIHKKVRSEVKQVSSKPVRGKPVEKTETAVDLQDAADIRKAIDCAMANTFPQLPTEKTLTSGARFMHEHQAIVAVLVEQFGI